MSKGFNFSKVSLTVSELSKVKGFSPDLNEALINFGVRQEQTNIMQLEFVRNMGFFCVFCSMTSTRGKVNADWGFYQNALLYIENAQETYDICYKDDSIHYFNYPEFCFSTAMMACYENMVEMFKDQNTDGMRMTYFFYQYLRACMFKIPSSELDQKKILHFLSFNKRSAFRLVEEQLVKINIFFD